MFQRRSQWKSKRRRKTIKRTLVTCWIICLGKPRPRPVYTGYHSLMSRFVKHLPPPPPPTLLHVISHAFPPFPSSRSFSPVACVLQTKVTITCKIKLNCGPLWNLRLRLTFVLGSLLRGSVLVYRFTRADTKDQTIHNS